MTGPRFFVVGCERSGSTLLRAMLDSHPDLVVPPESYFLVTHAPADPHAPTDPDAFAERVLADPDLARWRLDPDALRNRLHAVARPTFASLAAAVYDAYAEQAGGRQAGDKTPAYVMVTERLVDLFGDDLRFVHLVRDGRDVALSLVGRTHKKPDTVGEAALMWRRRVLAGLAAEQRLAGRCVRVTYEDLVAEPEAVLQQVCALLDVAFAPQMLDYAAQAQQYAAGHDHPEQHRNLARAPTAGLRSWRDELAPVDQAVVDLLAGDVLRRLGYPASGVRPTARARARALQARAGDAARHQGRRVRRTVGGRAGRAPALLRRG